MTRTDASARAPRSRRVAAWPSRGALRLAHPRHETVLDGRRGEFHLDVGEAAAAQVVAQPARDGVGHQPITTVRVVQGIAEWEHGAGIRVLPHGEEQWIALASP